jgi:hypothetical protein
MSTLSASVRPLGARAPSTSTRAARPTLRRPAALAASASSSAFSAAATAIPASRSALAGAPPAKPYPAIAVHRAPTHASDATRAPHTRAPNDPFRFYRRPSACLRHRHAPDAGQCWFASLAQYAHWAVQGSRPLTPIACAEGCSRRGRGGYRTATGGTSTGGSDHERPIEPWSRLRACRTHQAQEQGFHGSWTLFALCSPACVARPVVYIHARLPARGLSELWPWGDERTAVTGVVELVHSRAARRASSPCVPIAAAAPQRRLTPAGGGGPALLGSFFCDTGLALPVSVSDRLSKVLYRAVSPPFLRQVPA